MSHFRAAVCAALFLSGAAPVALAQDVTLTSRDGSVTVSGSLIGYDGEFYRVETEYGALTVDGTGVTCDGPGCPDLESFVAEFTLSGTRTMALVLLPALVEAFSARNGYRARRIIEDETHFQYLLTERDSGRTAARIGFRANSTAQGLADIAAGQADLAMALREPLPTEIARARAAGLDGLGDARRRLVIGLDALVPVVSPANPMRSISLEDLSGVLAGDIVDWSAFGGPPEAIHLHLRDSASGLTTLLDNMLLTPADRTLTGGITRHGANAGLSDAVARDPWALGITSFSNIDNARALEFRGSCGFGNRADPRALKTEDYPLTMPLFLYVGVERLPLLAREFLAFVRSPAAAPVIRRAGFVDLGIQDIALDAQGERLANAIMAAGDETGLGDLQRMVAVLRDATRLSVTFRFRDGTAELDAQSVSNIAQLADALEAGRYDGERLIFVGFSDGSGRADANLRLAGQRAEAVRRAVLDAAPFADRTRISLRLEAFGEAMPMACDDSAWGRGINRRVEVWKVQK